MLDRMLGRGHAARWGVGTQHAARTGPRTHPRKDAPCRAWTSHAVPGCNNRHAKAHHGLGRSHAALREAACTALGRTTPRPGTPRSGA